MPLKYRTMVSRITRKRDRHLATFKIPTIFVMWPETCPRISKYIVSALPAVCKIIRDSVAVHFACRMHVLCVDDCIQGDAGAGRSSGGEPEFPLLAAVPAMATVSKTVEHSTRMPWGFNSLPFRFETSCALGRAAKAPAFQAGKAGSIPAGHFLMIGDRLMVGCLPLKQAMEVQFLLPEPFCRWRVSDCRQHCGAVAAGSNTWL